MSIDLFRGEYHFLSNFAPCEIVLDNETYASVEHAYQAAKTLNLEHRKTIRLSKTPVKAKFNGKFVSKQIDWDKKKIEVMKRLLWQKFTIPRFKDLLLSTVNQELIEGNNWNDTFWGVCGGVGENNLGKLLMEIRAELA